MVLSSTLPGTPAELMNWHWVDMAPHYEELARVALTSRNLKEWMADWSRLAESVDEAYGRLTVATTANTADRTAEQRLRDFLDATYPAAQAADQKLKRKLLESGLEPDGFRIPLRNLRVEADLFRESNLPLLSDEQMLSTEYEKIVGAQTVTWQGTDLTVPQLAPVMQNPDRTLRERAWRLAHARRLADREAINSLWGKFMRVRLQIAANAGVNDYRSYRWRQMLRFDYSPEDSRRFRDAIEHVAVPAAARFYEKHRRRLGFDRLRPWDLKTWSAFAAVVDTPDCAPLHPFGEPTELEEGCSRMFRRVAPEFGDYFEIMRREQLLDLANRPNKGPGGYCTTLGAARRPFIFMNSVGIHDDVMTLLHEGGHAMHTFETNALPYFQQRAEHSIPTEFCEVASMGMELLASPYLNHLEGGFYSAEDARRARAEHLETNIFGLCYIAAVDAFQHWVYENPEEGIEPDRCDAQMQLLWDRFMPVVDWSGLEEECKTRWQRQVHIFTLPFYYLEYAMAQLGATQVWRNALADQAQAVKMYRHGLSLGATATLPELYQAAGARFAFEQLTVSDLVGLVEQHVEELDGTV